jgi:hypothetical protein
MVVTTLTYGSEIWAIYKKKDETEIKPAETKSLGNDACYRKKNQIRITKCREELNIFMLNA